MKILRVVLLTGAAVALAGGAVQAGNNEASTDHDWSGFYVGAYAGTTWSDVDIEGTGYDSGVPVPDDDAGYFDFSFSDTTATAGGQLGFNVQWNQIVLGAQADFGAFNIDQEGEHIRNPIDFVEASLETEWMLTVRPRLGVLATANLLLFATGGLAATEAKFESYLQGEGPVRQILHTEASRKKTMWGWVVGGGAEYALNERVSMGAEYLYADFGGFSTNEPIFFGDAEEPTTASLENKVDLITQTARIFINFGF